MKDIKINEAHAHDDHTRSAQRQTEHIHVHEPLPCDGEGHRHHHHEDGTCCCEHHAKEFHGIDKPMLARLIVGAICYLAARILPMGETAEMLLLLMCALIAGYDVIFSALKNVIHGRFFDEYFLMTLAAAAAFAIGEYEEAAAVFLLYRVGMFCQSCAIRHSRRTIAELTGDEDILSDASRASNPFITRFSRIYTPLVLVIAVLILLYCLLIAKTGWHDAVSRSLPFLVLACPCAIVISVPLAYFAGIGAASKKGVFFQNSDAVDALAKSDGDDLTGKAVTVSESGVVSYDFAAGDERGCKVVLNNASLLVLARRSAEKTRLVARENIWFTLAVKLAVLICSAIGFSALWLAVFADSGVTVLVVLNALRAFRISPLRK